MSPEVSTDTLSDDLIEEIRLGIQAYFVPLLGITPATHDRPPIVKLVGSGTLVEVGGRYYILTADHVWSHSAKWQQIGLGLAAEGTPLPLERDHIALTARRLGGPRYTRWGPDLALLEIPLHLVPTIQARKSFLNLARQRSLFLRTRLRMTKAVWAATGLVGRASWVDPLAADTGRVVANLYAAAFFGWRCRRTFRGAYDYLTTPAKTTMPGVPSRFSGLSGAALWQIALTQKKSTGAIGWRLRFCGVIFWDQPRPGKVVALTSHGPKSIFRTAWTRWELRKAIRAAGAGRPGKP